MDARISSAKRKRRSNGTKRPVHARLALFGLCLHALPGASALNGDTWCGSLMCVSGTVNGSIITYDLQALNALGWMSIGFGPHMPNTPLVILWSNADGSTTMSQRTATGLVEPVPDPHPPRQATLLSRSTASSQDPSTLPTLSFSVPYADDTTQNLIWAFSKTVPEQPQNSTLEQHLDAGPFMLNLNNQASGSTSTDTSPAQNSTASASPPTASSTASSSALQTAHFVTYDKIIVAHAVFASVGLLVIAPIAALIARWGRLFTRHWLVWHRGINVFLSIPLVGVGWALGPLAVAEQGSRHFDDAHKVSGLVIFLLFLTQLGLGAFVHKHRPVQSDPSHPPRNIAHILLGLLTIGLGFYQVRLGFSHEWSAATGRGNPPGLATISALWTTWVIILPVAYFLGYTLLPRQLAHERLGMTIASHNLPLFAATTPTPTAAPSTSTPSSRPDSFSTPAPGLRSLFSRADDGTHDAYSDEPSQSDASAAPAQPPPAYSEEIEMREVQTVLPISFQSRLQQPPGQNQNEP